MLNRLKPVMIASVFFLCGCGTFWEDSGHASYLALARATCDETHIDPAARFDCHQHVVEQGFARKTALKNARQEREEKADPY